MDADNEPAGVSIQARLNYDLLHGVILPFLPTHEISSLARTCWYFNDLTLSTLCARSGDVTLRKSTQIRSFHDFLHIGQLPSSRAPYIKELCFSISGHTFSPLPDLSTDALSEMETFVDLLRRCTALRRLCLNERSPTEVSPELVHKAVAELPMLQELRLRYRRGDIIRDICAEMAGRPLRKLRLLGVVSSPKSLLCLGPTTSNTLRELELPMHVHELALEGVVFPHVQKLSATVSHAYDVCPSMDVRTFACTFPALTHLVLRDTHGGGRWVDHAIKMFTHPQSPFPREPWPLGLKYVYADDPLAIYTTCLFRHTPHISIRWWTPYFWRTGRTLPTEILPAIVAVARPTALEIVHDNQQSLVGMDLGGFDRYAGLVLAGHVEGGAPLRKLAIHIHGSDFDSVDLSDSADADMELLGAAVAKMSVIHLLLKFTPYLMNGLLDCDQPYITEHAQLARRQSAVWAERLARASPNLRWVGMFVYGASLRSWTIVQPADARANVEMRELVETEGWKVLRAEGLYEFMAGFEVAPRAAWYERTPM